MIPGLTVIEEYISEEEEKKLLEFLYTQEWSNKLSRRTQHYGYEYAYTPPYDLGPAPKIPKLLQKYGDMISPGYFDQVIVNEYTPGQGIGKHTDHKRLFGDVIASISLGSGTTIIFSERDTEVELYVKPRTAIVMQDVARWRATHEIRAKKSDVVSGETVARGTRVSITYRKVSRTNEKV